MNVQEISQIGAAIVLAAPQLADSFLNDGRTFLLVDNADAAPITVTVEVQRSPIKSPGMGAIEFDDIVVNVPAGAQRFIAIPRSAYNGDDGRVSLIFSAVANITAAAIRMPAL